MTKPKMIIKILIMVGLAILLVGCSQGVELEEELMSAEPTEILPTKTPVPPVPTEIPDPTPEPIPTSYHMSATFTGVPQLANLTDGGPVFSMAWHPDSTFFANSGIESVLIWDLKDLTHAYILSGHEDTIIDLGWSPDGSTLASLSVDETLRLWAAPDYVEAAVFNVGTALSFDWSPAGDVIAIGAFNGEIQIWDVQSAQVQNTLPASEADADVHLMWSPDGTMLAAVHASGAVQIWSVENQEIVTALADLEGSPAADLAWSPNGEYLATGHVNGFVHLWDLDTWEIVQSLEAQNNPVTKIAWSPDGLMLAAGGDSTSVTVWDAATGEWLTGVAAVTGTWSLGWSPNGKFLVVGSAGSYTVGATSAWGGRSWEGDLPTDRVLNPEAGYIYIYILQN